MRTLRNTEFQCQSRLNLATRLSGRNWPLSRIMRTIWPPFAVRLLKRYRQTASPTASGRSCFGMVWASNLYRSGYPTRHSQEPRLLPPAPVYRGISIPSGSTLGCTKNRETIAALKNGGGRSLMNKCAYGSASRPARMSERLFLASATRPNNGAECAAGSKSTLGR